ncbi:MAG: hypothetical protein Q8P41_25080 [Pseudomonadota bacterium]|nr:hypothetical protein [Pseudomonadota bacterium]
MSRAAACALLLAGGGCAPEPAPVDDKQYEVVDLDCSGTGGLRYDEPKLITQLLARYEEPDGSVFWVVQPPSDKILAYGQFEPKCDDFQVGWRVFYLH